MEQYKSIIQLISYFDSFQKQTNNTSLKDFANWLLNQESRNEIPEYSPQKTQMTEQPLNVQLSILLGRMAKYAQWYTRQIIKESELSGLDDYTFLTTLMHRKSMIKSELTSHNIIEATTGADIIKRLSKKGFIEEDDDPSDKRSKRVTITPKGKEIMIPLLKKMGMVSNIVSGDLSVSEKANMIESLKKLDHFHDHIYHFDKKKNLEEIHEKYT